MQFHNIDAKKRKSRATHKNYEADFPTKSEKRLIQLNMLKNQLEAQQCMFIKPQQQRKLPFKKVFFKFNIKSLSETVN